MKHIKLKIKTNSQDYQIVIGSNLIKELSKILKSNSIKFRNCLLIIDKKIPKKKILDVKKSLRKKNVTTFFIKANENTLPLKPMTYWFTDWNDKYVINDFIRNENLEIDLNQILSKLGINNVKLEYLNKSKSIYNFRDLLDEKAMKWIFDNHYEDFINFGYYKNVY